MLLATPITKSYYFRFLRWEKIRESVCKTPPNSKDDRENRLTVETQRVTTSAFLTKEI